MIFSGSVTINEIASVSANQTTFTVSGLSAGTHYFAVTGVTDAAESDFSNIESKTILQER